MNAGPRRATMRLVTKLFEASGSHGIEVETIRQLPSGA